MQNNYMLWGFEESKVYVLQSEVSGLGNFKVASFGGSEFFSRKKLRNCDCLH